MAAAAAAAVKPHTAFVAATEQGIVLDASGQIAAESGRPPAREEGAGWPRDTRNEQDKGCWSIGYKDTNVPPRTWRYWFEARVWKQFGGTDGFKKGSLDAKRYIASEEGKGQLFKRHVHRKDKQLEKSMRAAEEQVLYRAKKGPQSTTTDSDVSRLPPLPRQPPGGGGSGGDRRSEERKKEQKEREE